MAFQKMLWVDSTPIVVVPSWDYWSSLAGNIITFSKIGGGSLTIQKTNNKIAYYCVVKVAGLYVPLCISPDMSATAMTSGTPTGRYVTDDNGIDWYFTTSTLAGRIDQYYAPECLLSDTEYPNTIQGYEQAVQDLIDRIYSIPLHENYVAGVGNTYTLNYTVKNLVFRKIVGTYLYKRIDEYDTNALYKGISDNALSLINNLNSMAYNSTFVHVHFDGNDPETLYVYHAYISNFMTGECVGDWSYLGYPCYSFNVLNSLPNTIDRLRVTYNTSQGRLYYTQDSINNKTMLPYTQGYTDVGLDIGSMSDLTMSNVGIELYQI